MSFWIRHALLLLVCVAFPFIAAVDLDTASEIRRATTAGENAARLASGGLETRLTLDAHNRVSAAMSLSQRLADQDLAAELQKKPTNAAGERKRDAALASAAELVKVAAPEGGFAWLVDESGAIVVRSDGNGSDEKPQLITGHPLFVETQDGTALDGLWRDGDRVAVVGAAPLIVRGQAQGAIFVGRYFDRTMIEALSSVLASRLTLIAGDKILLSALEQAVAESVVKDLGTNQGGAGGFLSKPLRHEHLPLLPIFIDHDMRGLAYSSLSVRVPGSEELRWVISVPAAEHLRDLAERQELELVGMVTFFMLALLLGLMNYRTFVTPIARITHHLSELQQGRGELELPEARVSAPFRRLVKLVNMMVQRLPSRGFPARSSASEPAVIGDVGAPASQPISVARDASISTLSRSTDLKLQDVQAASLDPRATPQPEPAPVQRADGLGLGADRRVDARAPSTAAGSSVLANAFESGPDTMIGDGIAAIAASQTESAGDDDEEQQAIAQALATLEGGATNVPSSTARHLSPSQSLSGQLRAPSLVGSTPPSPTPREASRTGSLATREALEAARSTGSISTREVLEAARTPQARARSAADIRGVPSESIASSLPFAPQPELYRGGLGPRVDAAPMEERTPIEDQMAPPTTQMPSIRGSSTARGGGSLNLAAYAGLGQAAGQQQQQAVVDDGGFNPEATVVAPVADELLRKSASREDVTDHHAIIPEIPSGDMTMVATVPPNLLAQTMGEGDGEGDGTGLQGLDAADHAHFKETYERFIEMRKRCGEPTGDLAFDRFLSKLAKNRESLVKKYNCRTVRFQVYEKDGKAALKATPVRAK